MSLVSDPSADAGRRVGSAGGDVHEQQQPAQERPPESGPVTHAELVTIAVRWLRRTKRCSVVLQEPPAQCAQSPDAIGWASAFSFLVECKVSRSDFFADQKKHGRQRGPRPAWRCYYLTPPWLLSPTEVPESWGLLETRGTGVRIVREVPQSILMADDRSSDALRFELRLLFAELRRYHVNGITYDTLTGRPAQAHVLDLAWADTDVREARRLMGLEGRP